MSEENNAWLYSESSPRDLQGGRILEDGTPVTVVDILGITDLVEQLSFMNRTLEEMLETLRNINVNI